MPHRSLILASACLLAGAVLAPLPGGPAAAAAAPSGPGFRAHVQFDTSNGPLLPGVSPGAPVQPLRDSGTGSAPAGSATFGTLSPTSRPGREVLGFVQNGEVTSGDWQADIKFNLVTTIAYFSIDVNDDGSLADDAGLEAYGSSQATSLFTTAHQNGDMVLATFTYLCGTASCDSGMNTLLTTPSAETAFVNHVVSEVTSRGVDGVDIDFEPDTGLGGDASQFTALMSQLKTALDQQAPASSYLAVDVYASAYQGGEMWNIANLAPVVNAVDVMTYSMNGPTQPNSPMGGNYAYTDPSVVNGFLTEMPADKLLLGIPYFGEVYSTTMDAFNAPVSDPSQTETPTYSGILSDFACVEQQNGAAGAVINWDSTSETPWAYWWGPTSDPPCGVSPPVHTAYRELYYDNAQSLGEKYALVNSDGLLGVGIWALGYDSGSDDLWNEIALTLVGGGYTVDAYGGLHQYGGAPYEAVSADYPGFNIIRGVALDACDPSGHSGWTVDGYGGMHQFGAAPYVTVYGGYYPGWDIIRGAVAWCDQGHAVGYTVDAYGGMHPFSDDPGGVEPPYPQVTGYWPGQYLTAGIVLIPGTDEGYVVDAYGGLHPFNGAPYYAVSAYYPGFNIVRGVTLLPGGGGGYTVDAYGGLHPFGSAPYFSVAGAYYPGWDIIRGVVAVQTVNGLGGYTLDAFGGLHQFGAAPYMTSAYLPGEELVVGIVFSAT
jgi:spore germination protein YaaH